VTNTAFEALCEIVDRREHEPTTEHRAWHTLYPETDEWSVRCLRDLANEELADRVLDSYRRFCEPKFVAVLRAVDDCGYYYQQPAGRAVGVCRDMERLGLVSWAGSLWVMTEAGENVLTAFDVAKETDG